MRVGLLDVDRPIGGWCPSALVRLFPPVGVGVIGIRVGFHPNIGFAAPGSIDTILAGGEPTETVPTLRRSNTTGPAEGYALRPTNHNALSQASIEELLLELPRRIIAPATDATKPGTTGTAASAM